ncbi:phospholipase D-like domain-containing protein [Anoxybacter fermentans]|uniref:phospholipase D-like domain-containing protein n=1 Tax=Anoxybacter fermentans TaxID=1323375 RepID=UPI000F8D1B27|nr:phospholipase D-like domain-containing protein [Anoxybacter fermentans]
MLASKRVSILVLMISLVWVFIVSGQYIQAANIGSVVINEVAWVGTTYSTYDEWIELYNTTNSDIDLSGWTLNAVDGTPSINLSGIIPAKGYFLLERTDDNSVPGISADLIYTGSLGNTGETLELRDASGTLIDSVDAWYAGDNDTKATMERTDPLVSGTDSSNWNTSTVGYDGGYGTPKALNSNTSSSGSSGGSIGGGTSDLWYDVYFSDNLNTVMPDYGPKNMANALVNAINSATTSIDFAIYGMRETEEILAALIDAVNRGVQVRGVVDSDSSGYYYYKDTQKLIDSLPAGAVIADNDDRIMHNKFFIFDDSSVWTGSTNISDTGINAEYNSNWSILIRHTDLALAYKQEFEEMYSGKFHDAKTDNTQHIFPPLEDGSIIECYFSPTDDATHNAIIRAINAAQSTLYIKIFYLTDQEIADAIIAAYNRGVDVKVIIDASGAANEFSKHEQLRNVGIPVKVENWGGKEHMKALVADGYIVIIGSQNWTGSGNTENDENTLYIENQPLAAAFTDYFNLHWNWIPDTWLAGNPGAESPNSVGSLSDFIDNDHDGLTDEGAPESINTVETGPGAINVYFNKGALTRYATTNNLANHHVNLEDRLIERINNATTSIDMAIYEINLPRVVDALIKKAQAGVNIRLIVDAKQPSDATYEERYQIMRLYLEKMARGGDGIIGTSDDIIIFSDSPIFAVEDSILRGQYGLPSTPDGINYVTVTVAGNQVSGYLFVDAEQKSDGTYYSPSDQMHNKFVIFDNTWVWTGSWNFTETGLYGSEENRLAGILGGNTQHVVEINSVELADIFKREFDEMWGSSTMQPDPQVSNFHSRKVDNTAHVVDVGGRIVEVYFSPGDDAIGHITNYVRNNADFNAYFTIFAWSNQTLLDELKYLWEGSKEDLIGTLTGFDVKGVFDSSYWNSWWSASVDMTGRTASYESLDNPNTRWANPAPVYKDGEDRKLHSKTMLIDADTNSDPVVIVGSANWSANGNDVNDENILIIHDANIVNQFLQEFYARYYMAGGRIPMGQ